jgi:hypothetical protein
LFLSSLLPAVAVLLLTPQSIYAQSSVGCIGHHFDAVQNGITYLEAHTNTGRTCQIGFGVEGDIDVGTLRIVTRPAHGVLGVSKKEMTKRYVAYVPRAGFVGHDRFEIFIRVMARSGRTWESRIKVEMNVAP